jgi:glucose 1-dehydrogenase
MFHKMVKQFGAIDILINNAGLQKDAPFDEMTLEQWNFVIAVNLTGQFLCAGEAIRRFKSRGVVKEVSCAAGKIVCISSVHEVILWAGRVNYTASKGGVTMLMKSIGKRWLLTASGSTVSLRERFALPSTPLRGTRLKHTPN